MNESEKIISSDLKKIGIFDSGLGGLSILKNILEYPAHYIYIADTANVPFGAKTPEQLKIIASSMVSFLDKHAVDTCIIACYTICATALSYLKIQYPHIQFIDIIEPSVYLAAQTTKNNRIGVIGTKATIASGIHSQRLKTINNNLRVIEQACPRLASCIEYYYDNPVLLHSILEEDLSIFQNSAIDTLILGCTHYSLVQEEIRNILGREILLINGYDSVSRLNFTQSTTGSPKISLYVTQNPEEFSNKAKQIFDLAITAQKITLKA